MTTQRDLIVEYSYDGTPTGNCWVDGVKHTISGAPNFHARGPGTLQANPQGPPTTIEPARLTLAYNGLFPDNSVLGSVTIVSNITQQPVTVTIS